jgi:hypothetical protein
MKDLNNDTTMMDDYAQMEWEIFQSMDTNLMDVEEISTSNLHCKCDQLMNQHGYWETSMIKAMNYTIEDERTHEKQ